MKQRLIELIGQCQVLAFVQSACQQSSMYMTVPRRV